MFVLPIKNNFEIIIEYVKLTIVLTMKGESERTILTVLESTKHVLKEGKDP